VALRDTLRHLILQDMSSKGFPGGHPLEDKASAKAIVSMN
jgi:hypothetical protein